MRPLKFHQEEDEAWHAPVFIVDASSTQTNLAPVPVINSEMARLRHRLPQPLPHLRRGVPTAVPTGRRGGFFEAGRGLPRLWIYPFGCISFL